MKISIKDFISLYYGISLDANSKYSHDVIIKAFNGLKRCSFDFAEKNPELVNSGKIIYVVDDYDKTYPYICPKQILISVGCYCSSVKKKDSNLDNCEISRDIIRKVPTYVLHELLSVYKNRPSIYRIIRQELVCRGEYANKVYKIKKVIIEMEEYDDDISKYDFSQCHDRCNNYYRRLRIKSERRKSRRGRCY